MLPSHQVELGILRYTRVGASDEWRATTLPELANAVGCQDWNQVTDATKRLHAREVIRIRKWFEPHGFAFYKGEEDNISFFHRGGGFQLGITFEGRTYAESLEAREKLEAIASPKLGTAAILATETLDRNLASSFEVISKVMSNPALVDLQVGEALRHIEGARLNLEKIFDTLPIVESARLLYERQTQLTFGMQPIVDAYKRVGEQLARDFEQRNQTFRNALVHSPFDKSFHAALEQARAIQGMNLSLPKILSVAWPFDILATRLVLIEDALKNVNVWEKLRDTTARVLADATPLSTKLSTVDVAGQFVFDHSVFIRRLPPSVEADKETRSKEEEFRHRDEEVGAQLEKELASLDTKLLYLRRRAWENMGKGDPGGVRLAAAGVRELYTEVLHRLAPDDQLLKTDIWQKRTDKSVTKPTRRMRIEFIAGDVSDQLDMLVQFTQSIERANEFTHTFAENPEIVRVFLSQLENCAYLLLTAVRRKKT